MSHRFSWTPVIHFLHTLLFCIFKFYFFFGVGLLIDIFRLFLGDIFYQLQTYLQFTLLELFQFGNSLHFNPEVILLNHFVQSACLTKSHQGTCVHHNDILEMPNLAGNKNPRPQNPLECVAANSCKQVQSQYRQKAFK